MRRAIIWLLLACLVFLAGRLSVTALRRAAEAKKPAAVGTSPPVGKLLPQAPSPSRPALEPPSSTDGQTGHPEAAAFGTAAIPADREPTVLLGFFQFYRREFGSFPTGNEPAHFLNALAGTNPGKLVIFPRQHPRVSPDGALLDAWGSPFHIHPVSRDHLEVRSAGPDRTLFTDDDLVVPKNRGNGAEGKPR
jgi:hypothetical protein